MSEKISMDTQYPTKADDKQSIMWLLSEILTSTSQLIEHVSNDRDLPQELWKELPIAAKALGQAYYFANREY